MRQTSMYSLAQKYGEEVRKCRDQTIARSTLLEISRFYMKHRNWKHEKKIKKKKKEMLLQNTFMLLYERKSNAIF